MKSNLVTAVNNRDASALARMSQGQVTPRVVNSDAEKMVDMLFDNLKQIFPASVSTILKNKDDEKAAKRQWIAAFAENGITTREQLQNGMRQARASDNPFWPAVGQFIKWCKQEDYTSLGLPTEAELYEMYREYCSIKGWSRFKWASNACYWMVTKIYSDSRSKGMTDLEVKKMCTSELLAMSGRIKSGEKIPDPVLQLDRKNTPTSRDKSLSIIANLKQKYGFK
ncbi:hypothetical protein M2263_002335 [Providencia alcalifaciens]|nr:hypothetical protein [Providencia alcalifaciens]